MYLSIIIPAYNEEKRIQNTLLKVRDFLVQQNYEYEIIVVNDGSTDKTLDIVNQLKSKINSLILIDHKENKGKGFAVRGGMLQAKGDYKLFMDADGSSPIEEVEKFFPYLKQGNDVVIGSRAIKGANITLAQNLQRKFLGFAFRMMTKILAGLWGFNDTQCGFKIFDAKSANDIFSKCKINGWSFDVEVLVLARKLGYLVKEVPINWHDSPGTKVKMTGMVRSVFDLLVIRWLAFSRFLG